MKKVFLGISLMLIANISSGQKEKSKALEFPMTEKHWAATTDNVEFLNYKSVAAVRSNNKDGFGIMLKDFEFADGTIEFDVELKGMGFPGIVFRSSKDSLNGEIFYIRYFGKPDNHRRTTLQYASIQDGVNMWDMTDDYQAAARINESGWNHVKLVIHGKQMKAYVNDMEQTALEVPALEGITTSGRIELTGNVIYSNFVIRPNATEGLPRIAGYDPTANDSRYLRNWSVTEPIDFPFGRDIIKAYGGGESIDSVLYNDKKVWKSLKAERRGLVNLTRLFGNTEQGQRRLTWVKTNISSQNEQSRRIHMGFSDEIWVLVNGKLLHIDKNYYGSPSMKEPRGRCTIENSSFMVPLQKGDNELLIGVTNYFFGWGIIARFDDAGGLVF